jgi:hypothetical protein
MDIHRTVWNADFQLNSSRLAKGKALGSCLESAESCWEWIGPADNPTGTTGTQVTQPHQMPGSPSKEAQRGPWASPLRNHCAGLLCAGKLVVCLNTISFLLFLRCWGLNSGPIPWATPPELFLWWVFQDRVSWTICPGWLRTSHPPDLCLLNSWDYRHEARCPAEHHFVSETVGETIQWGLWKPHRRGQPCFRGKKLLWHFLLTKDCSATWQPFPNRKLAPRVLRRAQTCLS